MRLKSVLVDLDGTLADSLPTLFNFYQTFLGHYQAVGSAQEFQALNGATLDEVVRYLKEIYHLAPSVEDLSTAYQAGIEKEYAVNITPFADVQPVLQRLCARGITLAIVTSAPRWLLAPFLKRHQLAHLFAFAFTGEEISKGKPDPEIYEKAFKHLRSSKENTCVIEDSPNGIQAALAAGFHVVALNSVFPEHPKVAKALNWLEIELYLKKRYELSDL